MPFFASLLQYCRPSGIIAFLRRWNETYLVVFLLLNWSLHNVVIRWLDATAAPLDAGVLSTIYLTMLSMSSLHLFVWVGLRLNMPAVHGYFEKQFDCDLLNLTVWQRACLSFSFLALYLLATVLCFLGAASLAG